MSELWLAFPAIAVLTTNAVLAFIAAAVIQRRAGRFALACGVLQLFCVIALLLLVTNSP